MSVFGESVARDYWGLFAGEEGESVHKPRSVYVVLELLWESEPFPNNWAHKIIAKPEDISKIKLLYGISWQK